MRDSVYIILIAVLVVALAISLSRRDKEIVESHTVDTVTVLRIDTVFYGKPEYVYEKTVDTIFLEKESGGVFEIPITQRFYQEDTYKAWVSGYEPRLDSIAVFNKVLTNTVTNTVTRNVYPKTFDIYVSLGCFFVNGNASPGLGAFVKFKNDFVFGGNVGYLNSDMFYGLSVGFKINGKNGKHD